MKCFESLVPLLLTLFPDILLCHDNSTRPSHQPLTMQGDLSAQMVVGIDKFLTRELDLAIPERQKFWQRDTSSPAAYEKSVRPNRDRFRKSIGVVDPRRPVTELEFVGSTVNPARVAETADYTVFAVRWPVLENVYSEGLFLRPKGTAVARIVAVPDADQTPEMLVGLAPGLPPEAQFARRLAENGCLVLVPTLVNREDTWSGNERLDNRPEPISGTKQPKHFTNQPHREWIYRQSYEMGRHIIGYEVSKIQAAVDWFGHEAQSSGDKTRDLKIGVAGYGEGGLLAFYTAALDNRIDAALVSGYFDSRQHIWEEPIYRNVFGLLHEFGDAEIASLVAPRALIVEYNAVPKVEGPPRPADGRSGAAPGRLKTPVYSAVETELQRARGFLGGNKQLDRLELIAGDHGAPTGPGCQRALAAFLKQLDVKSARFKKSGVVPKELRPQFRPEERQHEMVKQLVDFTQLILHRSEDARVDFFWNKPRGHSPAEWDAANRDFKNMFWEEILGKLPPASVPINPRSRQIIDNPKWACYEVVLDVFPDVYAWGYFLVPKDIKPGERRPVVVCQHGLEGLPADTITEDTTTEAYGYYKAYAARLAERGFVVFTAHNPYRGGDSFRWLQRKANPLKVSIFSFITAQHSRILDWLSQQPFVDPARIGFYGLSYGGKTAIRICPLLDRYSVVITSGDFNEWITKNVSVDSPYSYMFYFEWEMPEFNIGSTFGYGELAAMIAPRPFMDERGHFDGVGPDEWVASEYAKVRRLYVQLGIPEKTEIEFFNGPHTINGKGSFDFLHKYLNWPKP